MKVFSSKLILLLIIISIPVGSSWSISYQKKAKFRHFVKDLQSGITIGVNAGSVSKNLLSHADFQYEKYSSSLELMMSKELNKSFLLEGNIRLGGDLQGQNENSVLNLSETYLISKPIDVTLSLAYEKMIQPRLSISGSAGLGIIRYGLQYVGPEYSIKNDHVDYRLIYPLTVAMKFDLSKRLAIGGGYKYYLTFNDKFDGLVKGFNKDTYSFAYVGAYFKLTKSKFSRRSSFSRYCPRF